LGIFTQIHSQTKHGNQWVIGHLQNVLDFNTTVTQLDTSLNYSIPLMAQGKSNICDSNGQLLILCNGMRLFNAAGNLIEQGDTLVPEAYYVGYGSVSAVSQSSIILPVDSDQYYVFTPVPSDSNFNTNWVNGNVYFDELWYHRIDMRANGGAGKVIEKRVPLIKQVKLSQSQMMACRHANGKDWWLVKMALDSNKAYVFFVSHDTILLQHTIDFPPYLKIFGELHGQSSFDATGEHFATVSNKFGGEFFYGDFDRCTGMLSSMKRAVAPPLDRKSTRLNSSHARSNV
jgi:hypothetical protein